MEAILYDGRYRIKLTGNHRYYAMDTKEDKPKFISARGTTGVTKHIDSGDALIWWGVNKFRDHLEEFLKVGKIVDEIEKHNLLENGRRSWQRTRDEAATAGTLTHIWLKSYVDYRLGKTEKPTLPTSPRILNCVKKYFSWEKDHNVEYLATEEFAYNPDINVCGTLDARATIDSFPGIIDLKTGNGIYIPHIFQLAGYQGMKCDELKEDLPNSWIIKINHKAELMALRQFQNWRDIYEAFIRLAKASRVAIDMQKELEEKIKNMGVA